MKKPLKSEPTLAEADDLLPEYQFDYSKARPNRFAGRINKERLVVVLDPDVSKVFTSPEAVNNMLRALIAALPKNARRKAGQK